MIASPAPNKKRTVTNTNSAKTSLGDTKAVSEVNAPHHEAPAVSTRRGP